MHIHGLQLVSYRTSFIMYTVQCIPWAYEISFWSADVSVRPTFRDALIRSGTVEFSVSTRGRRTRRGFASFSFL